jgi:hypothetical protein
MPRNIVSQWLLGVDFGSCPKMRLIFFRPRFSFQEFGTIDPAARPLLNCGPANIAFNGVTVSSDYVVAVKFVEGAALGTLCLAESYFAHWYLPSLGQQFSQRPYVIRQPRLDSRGNADSRMHPAPIVVREMQGASGFQVVELLAVTKRQACKPFKRLTNREVLTLDITGRDVPGIWASVPNFYYRLRKGCRRVPSRHIVLAVIAEYFYHLREVSLSREHILYALAVEVKAIGAQLETVFLSNATPQRLEECVGCFSRPLANCVSGNQFRVRVHRHEDPRISKLRRVLWFDVTLFLSTKSPNLISLNPLAAKIAELRVHQLRTAFASENQQPQNRVAVQSGDALCGANRSAFEQKLNRQKCLIFRNRHIAKQASTSFGIGLATLPTAETAKAVALRPELHAFAVASRAIHRYNLQQAVAVCQANNLQDSPSETKGVSHRACRKILTGVQAGGVV